MYLAVMKNGRNRLLLTTVQVMRKCLLKNMNVNSLELPTHHSLKQHLIKLQKTSLTLYFVIWMAIFKFGNFLRTIEYIQWVQTFQKVQDWMLPLYKYQTLLTSEKLNKLLAMLITELTLRLSLRLQNKLLRCMVDLLCQLKEMAVEDKYVTVCILIRLIHISYVLVMILIRKVEQVLIHHRILVGLLLQT